MKSSVSGVKRWTYGISKNIDTETADTVRFDMTSSRYIEVRSITSRTVLFGHCTAGLIEHTLQYARHRFHELQSRSVRLRTFAAIVHTPFGSAQSNIARLVAECAVCKERWRASVFLV